MATSKKIAGNNTMRSKLKSTCTTKVKSWNGFHHGLLSTPQVILEKDNRDVIKALGNMTRISKSGDKHSKSDSRNGGVCYICTTKFSGGLAVSESNIRTFNDLIFNSTPTHKDSGWSPSICPECAHAVNKVGRVLKQIKNLEEELQEIVACVRMAILSKNGVEDAEILHTEMDCNAYYDPEVEEQNDYPYPNTPESFQGDEEDVKPFFEDLEIYPLDLLASDPQTTKHEADPHPNANKAYQESSLDMETTPKLSFPTATTSKSVTNVLRKRPGPKSKTEPLSATVKRKRRLKAEELLRTSLLALEAEDVSQVDGGTNVDEVGDEKQELENDDSTYESEDDEDPAEDDVDDTLVDNNNPFPTRKPRSRTWDLPCKCLTCGKSFKKRNILASHIRSVHERILRFTCSVVSCGKRFYKRHDLTVHERCVHSVKDASSTNTVDCHLCGRTFSRKRSLTDHLKEVHEKIRPFKCDREGCNKAFARAREYKYHIRRHDERSQKHLCSVCGKQFSHSDTLNRHLRDEHDQHPTQRRQEYPCTFPGCSKIVKKHNLNRHLETHKAQEKRTSCPTCNEVFPTIQSREHHQRSVHEGKSNFQCETCGKSFPRRISLKIHYKTHTSEKPFQCGKCSQRFKHRNSYVLHCKIVCGTDEKEKDKIKKRKKDAHIKHRKKYKKYACDKCDHKFMNVLRLEDHLRRVHNMPIASNDDNLIIPIDTENLSEPSNL